MDKGVKEMESRSDRCYSRGAEIRGWRTVALLYYAGTTVRYLSCRIAHDVMDCGLWIVEA